MPLIWFVLSAYTVVAGEKHSKRGGDTSQTENIFINNYLLDLHIFTQKAPEWQGSHIY